MELLTVIVQLLNSNVVTRTTLQCPVKGSQRALCSFLRSHKNASHGLVRLHCNRLPDNNV